LLNQIFNDAFIGAHPLLITALFILLIAAAIYDFRTFTIPHAFTYGVIALFAISLFFVPFSLSFIAWHILAGFLAFIAALILYILGLMGGGDVKVFGAIGLWVLPSGLLGLIFCVTISGLFVSITYLLVKILTIKNEEGVRLSFADKIKAVKSTKIAYGPAITLGTIIYYFISTQY
jgi:prepilin peptidase CpaA